MARASFLPLLAFAFGASFSSMSFAQENQAASRAIAAMNAAAGAELSVARSSRTGLATFVAAPSGQSIPVPDQAAQTPEARARSFVQGYGGAFGRMQTLGNWV